MSDASAPGGPGTGPDDLDAAVRVGSGPGAHAWDVPDGWQQGRGAFGGLVIAGLLRAVESEAEPDRRLRSVSAQLVGPLPAGPAVVEVAPVRRGSAVSTYSAQVRSPGGDGAVQARAVAVLGAARALEPAPGEWASAAPQPPPAPDWRDVATLPPAPGLAPVFLQHVDVRVVRGWIFGASDDDVVAWVRFRLGSGVVSSPYDEVGVVALVDAMWPAALVREAVPRPMATLTFEAAVLVDPATLDPAAPLLHRGRLVAGRDGYLVEVRELWTPDGRLVVHNVQTMVLIR